MLSPAEFYFNEKLPRIDSLLGTNAKNVSLIITIEINKNMLTKNSVTRHQVNNLHIFLIQILY